MISVGIRELKSHLSQYIELVKNGENIIITEHNKVVAELKTPEPNKAQENEVQKISIVPMNDNMVITKDHSNILTQQHPTDSASLLNLQL
jgi:antitoxin (DNA-binding transcriptional repressor) of toxin-antitoxin stability system